VAIDGVAYDDGAAVVKKIRTSPGVPLELTYARHGTRHTVRVVPSSAKDGATTIGRIGFVRVPNYVRVGPLDAIKLAGLGVWTGIGDNFSGIAALIKNPIERSQGLSGVIGMERAASEVQDFGWGPYLQLVAMISIALGVFNLLPIPALDGGRGIFIIAEMLRGRPVDAEKEALVHFTGFAVLMALMVFVAYHDIANIVAGKGVF
jgi:regulator of sigma E protease